MPIHNNFMNKGNEDFLIIEGERRNEPKTPDITLPKDFCTA